MSIQKMIEESLVSHFTPSHMEVENESHMHASGKGSESHFRCVIVSTSFEGQSLLARHRAVHDALAEPRARGVHALAIHAYTPEEWALRDEAPASPACGGRR